MALKSDFRLKSDFHIHSDFSGDSDTPMEEMICAALSMGLDTICFTEHHDLDYPVTQETPAGYFELNTDSYLYDLIRLKEKYAGQIDVLFGVELGLQPHLTKALARYAKSYDFDFIIGSTHLCKGQDVYYPPFFEGKTDEECYREYFEEIYTNIRKFQNFDVCGHLDYVVRYGATMDQDYCYEKYQDIFDRILTFLIEQEKGIELNTGGLYKGLKEPHPCIGVLKRYKKLGGEIITFGSDAHTPDRIAYGAEKICELLKDCGFRYYSIFRNRVAEYRKL
ncbi:MAG: histidinol-phosphatase HisJ family protein [Clostridiales bacterium]|nr:histidinol-phosphatase HisJ family protein [Clostridiales bacterium]